MASNQWAYDTAQPPLVYTGKVGGKTRRVVSVATMEGVWFAYDAATGAPIYQRVKVIDRTEHPPLQPGKPVTVYPSSLGGLNFSPASYDPKTNYIYNAAAETASVLQQADLTPTQKKQKLVQGSVFLGLENGRLRPVPARLARPRLDQRDRRQHRQAGLEVHDARAGARRRHDDRQRARLRGRRRRRPARVRREDRQGALDVPDRPSDRGRPLDLLGRRQGVPRDHGRRHAHLVGRRHRDRAAGVRARRLLEAVAAAGAADGARCRRRTRRGSRR